MNSRSNEDWLRALGGQPGEARNEAIEDLHSFLLRAVLVYLTMRRSELKAWSAAAVRSLAEDLVQEALLEILEHLETFKKKSRFTTWAYRFVINRAASELRRFHYQNVSLDGLRDDTPAAFESLVAEHESAGQIGPEQLAEQRQYAALLSDIVQKELTEHQRAAVVGVHWQGRSMDEVAAALGLTRNALYKLLHEARKRIKAQLLAKHLSKNDILGAFEKRE